MTILRRAGMWHTTTYGVASMVRSSGSRGAGARERGTLEVSATEVGMPLEKLRQLLEGAGVDYETIPHSTAFTAQEAAAAAHIPGREVAKVVMVKLDGAMAMVVLEAPDHVNLERLGEVAGAGAVELATESEFRNLFPNCEPGAMPPFGNLWDMPVFVDTRLREAEQIAFAAGSHRELVRMAYGDFERLVNPAVAELSRRGVET
jgi:Ala-tRNA(Pro) deacylase